MLSSSDRRIVMQLDQRITLRPLNADNWRQCAELTVLDHQRSWLPSNLHSIAAAQFYPDNFCRAIYAGERMVGFGMYGIEQPTGRVKVFRLMIDATAQHRGHGTAAMQAILQEIAKRWPSAAVYVSYQDDNTVARKLYDRLGFREVERDGAKITAKKFDTAST